MGSFSIFDDKIILGIHRTVLFIDIETSDIALELKIPATTTQKHIEQEIEDKNKEDSSKETANSNTNSETTIQNVAISLDRNYLAVTTSGLKSLFLYSIAKSGALLLSERPIQRASSGLIFTNDSKHIFVCDKTGDVHLYDCNEATAPPKWILGHLSIVLDVLLAPNDQFLITCDRDEKIRVSNYPKCYEIHSYCLGHIEYVSSIKFFPSRPEECLLSVSGDKTMRLWNYIEGTEIFKLDIPAPGIKIAVREVQPGISHVAVLVFQPDESVFIYELRDTNSKFESKLISKHSFPSQIITNLDFHRGKLFLTAVVDKKLTIEALSWENGSYIQNGCDELNEKLQKSLAESPVGDLDDISLLFKKKFDNVAEYMERKKRRIEEKEQSGCS